NVLGLVFVDLHGRSIELLDREGMLMPGKARCTVCVSSGNSSREHRRKKLAQYTAGSRGDSRNVKPHCRLLYPLLTAEAPSQGRAILTHPHDCERILII